MANINKPKRHELIADLNAKWAEAMEQGDEEYAAEIMEYKKALIEQEGENE